MTREKTAKMLDARLNSTMKSDDSASTLPGAPGASLRFDVSSKGISCNTEIEKNRGPAGDTGGQVSILVADDDQELLKLYVLMLQYLGYRVTGMCSGIQALEAFRAEPNGFGLVITDQIMPKMTGLELAREVLRIRPEIPIILCTGSSMPEKEVMASGVRALLIKPATMSDFSRTIRRVLCEDNPQGRSATGH
jgi:CheY-like chemotaxis protein